MCTILTNPTPTPYWRLGPALEELMMFAGRDNDVPLSACKRPSVLFLLLISRCSMPCAEEAAFGQFLAGLVGLLLLVTFQPASYGRPPWLLMPEGYHV